jgi:hypothetical protein
MSLVPGKKGRVPQVRILGPANTPGAPGPDSRTREYAGCPRSLAFGDLGELGARSRLPIPRTLINAETQAVQSSKPVPTDTAIVRAFPRNRLRHIQ